MLLQVKNLRCGYGSLEAVRGASLHVCAGEIVGLLGANGAGKSSLLKAIIGLLPAWSGDVRMDGRTTTGQPAWKSISNSAVLVPEGKMIFADMTVRENLRLGAYTRGNARSVEEDMQHTFGYFPRLRDRMAQRAGTLSGGEQQMLAIARALMSRPRLLLLDEPSLGLAPLLVKEIFRIIGEIHAAGTTVVLVEQNAHMALQVADYAYLLETGRVVLSDSSAALRQREEVRRVYLGH